MKRLGLLIIVVLLLLPVVSALAQEPEATPEPTPTVTELFPEVPTTEQAGNDLLAFLLKYTGGAQSLLVVIAAVELLKRTPRVKDLNPALLNVTVSLVVTAVVWFARKYGMETDASRGLDFLGGLLALVLNFGGAVGSTALGSGLAYHGAKYVGILPSKAEAK